MLIASLLWYKKFCDDLEEYGFEFNPYDPCVDALGYATGFWFAVRGDDPRGEDRTSVKSNEI